MSCGGSERRTISRPEVASRYVPACRLEILYTPRPKAFQKRRGGLSYIDGGGVNLVKDWASLYRFPQLHETNSVAAFRVRDPGLNGGYGHGGVLSFRNGSVVRLEYSEVGATGLRTTQRGVPGRYRADWRDLAWGRRSELNRVVARPVCGWAAHRALSQYEDGLRPTG